MASLVPRLAPGTTFADRFRILEYVGQGSMGCVYRAAPLAGGEPVALKLVWLDPQADGRALHRFEREVESGRRVRSPFVAATLESGKLGERLAWLSMEFAPGVTLEERVRTRGALPSTLARRVLGQLFEAVTAAHAEGIVHRDLKPDNLRIAGEADELTLKVLDFGIAKDLQSDSVSRTKPGLGAPLWSAPELSDEDEAPKPSADVWSLGLLCFFVLTGKLYWRHAVDRASVADLAFELVKGEIVAPSARVEELGLELELPRGFDAWFARAVNRDAALRFANAAAAWAELEPLFEVSAPSAERPALVVKPGAFLTAVLVSCMAAGLAIYWLLRTMRI